MTTSIRGEQASVPVAGPPDHDRDMECLHEDIAKQVALAFNAAPAALCRSSPRRLFAATLTRLQTSALADGGALRNKSDWPVAHPSPSGKYTMGSAGSEFPQRDSGARDFDRAGSSDDDLRTFSFGRRKTLSSPRFRRSLSGKTGKGVCCRWFCSLDSETRGQCWPPLSCPPRGDWQTRPLCEPGRM